MTIGESSVPADTAQALADEGRRVRSFIASNRSDTLLRLFDFLLQQSIEGRCPKETEIAEEIFRVGSSEPGHQGSRVRVGVYRLRKKLDMFYADKSGAQLTIPPGEYVFVLKTPGVESKNDWAATDKLPIARHRSSLIFAAILILLLVNVLFASFYFGNALDSSNGPARSKLWQPFSSSKRHTFFVIGDYFMFERAQDGDEFSEVIQDLSIGDVDTFYEHLNKTPENRNYFINDDLYAVSSDILGSISKLSSYLKNVPLQPTTSSNLNPDMMKSSDIIYLGALDAMSPLLRNPLLEASKFRCGKTCYELIDTPSRQHFLSDSPYLLADKIVPRRDYGYIASYPGPSGNQILILSGTGDAGAAQMANVVMDAKMVQQLRQRVGGNLRSFEALYHVRTMFNRSYGSTLLIARPINAERIWDKTRHSE
ncbi:hypothetical protein [Novosphingobium sp. KN65.2]|nr:hypothetical protein [Novosphingobium sp. KN65.2]CDO34335.1 conserved hypothetical protein [Novosphingobium sp. KN65.2]